MKTLLISLRAFGRRLAHAAGHYLDRASAGASDGLEEYLSTAKSLHQLENMQRQWERAHRGPRHHGAY